MIPVRLAAEGNSGLSSGTGIAGATPTIEVKLSNDRLLRLSEGAALAWVAALADALERR